MKFWVFLTCFFLVCDALAQTYNQGPTRAPSMPSLNINGMPCYLGSACIPMTPASQVGIGSTIVFGGASGKVLYDNGTLGELSTTGSGSVALTTGTGVNCSGAPTASFATINGVVTHC